MNSELFPNSPEQRKPQIEMLDLAELDDALEHASKGTFAFSRNVEGQEHIITAYGKGMSIKFKFDTLNNSVSRIAYNDNFTDSGDSHIDVAPRALDTDDLLNQAESDVKKVIAELVDPTLIEKF